MLTLAADGSQVGGTKPRSTASVIERTRVFSTHSLQPGRIDLHDRGKVESRARRGLQKGFHLHAAMS